MLLIFLLIIKIYRGTQFFKQQLVLHLVTKTYGKKSLLIDSKISSISMDNNYLFVCLFTVN